MASTTTATATSTATTSTAPRIPPASRGARYAERCSDLSGGSDVAWAFTAPAAGTYAFSTYGSAVDTVVVLYDACGGSELPWDLYGLDACDDDDGDRDAALLVRDLAAGQTVLVAVETAWPGGDVRVAAYPVTAAEVCGNGFDDDASGATDCHDAACAGGPTAS